MTVPQALQIAVQHHQAGRLSEAEALYRQILAVQPKHAETLYLLGVIAHQVARNGVAVEMIRQAIAVNPAGLHYYLIIGNVLFAEGRLDEAVAAYRRALELEPRYPEVYNNLGNALRVRGQFDEAVAACRRALQLKPDFPEAQVNLGNALRDRGQFDEAIASYRCALKINPNIPEAQNNLGNALRDQHHLDKASAAYRNALQLKPDYPEAHNNLGITLRDQGQLDEGIAAYRRAIELKSDYPEAHNNLGVALREQGRLDEAIATYRRALELKSDYPETLNNLGGALRKRGQLDEAVAVCRRALELKPSYSEAHINLGNALAEQGQCENAIASYRRALKFKPDCPEVHTNLGTVLREQGQLDEAVASYRHALQLQPDLSETHNNLGNALKDQGELDKAIGSLRNALRLKPEDARFHSNLVYTLHFHPGQNAGAIAEERQRWNRQFSEPLKRFVLPHANDRNPERRLRIGYVSPNFCDHVVGRYLVPLFQCRDHGHFEILCYSGVVQPDQLTEEFRIHAQEWRSTVGVGDEALAEMIRQDGVDILVDLTQHMAGNRLQVFARKPAPIQVSFAGYPESTGLEAIENRISDRRLEAGSAHEETGRKEKLHLIDSFWCYDPCGVGVEVNGLPARESGRITFGCLNNFCKVNERVLDLWVRVLENVTDSRIVISSNAGGHRQRTLDALERQGVAACRVEFVEVRPRREYLELYHRLDIVLDTFPYNGGVTTCDALWMGVPVVSLVGEAPVSRAGLSLLTNLGLPELVAHSEAEYVRIAVELGGDLPRLARLRSTLRGRMEKSVLMDARRFTQQVEQAYREMWRSWCSNQSPGSEDI